MKKSLIIQAAMAFFLFCVIGIQARVLVVIEAVYFHLGGVNYFVQYCQDVQNIDHKIVDSQVMTCPDSFSTQARCRVLWNMIRDEYQQFHSATNPDSCLEGVVLIGNLPSAWREDLYWGKPYNVPDDRYFMDIYNNNTHACYNTDSDVWDFDPVKNLFTNYHSGDNTMDIWVSRIMANQIRGLREGLLVMDENTIINNYLERVHERMTQPAKVPPQGFAMGWISEWSKLPPGEIDPVKEMGFTSLNLQRVYKFDTTAAGYTASTPANWLLQLLWGPWGGTTLGAFNGNKNIPFGPNIISIPNYSLYDLKSGTTVSLSGQDTLGYEWAGIYEHSTESNHGFNGGSVGNFFHATLGPFWWNNWRYWSNSPDTCYGGSYYKYNAIDSVDPWNTNLDPALRYFRNQSAIFTKQVLNGGYYKVYMYYPAWDSNSYINGSVADLPPKYNYSLPYGGNISFTVDQAHHCLPEKSGSNWEQLIHIDMNIDIITHDTTYDTIRTVNLLAGDSVRIVFNNFCSPKYLIADAIKLADNTDTIIIDNDSATGHSWEFSSDDWYDRSFMDMQDEDNINHAAYSKVPFFVSAGCEVGNYFSCYDPLDTSHQTLTTIWGTNLGLLYGMAHSGLISLTSAISYPGNDYSHAFSPFTQTIASKDAFGRPNTAGDALRAQYNYNSNGPGYPPDNFGMIYSFIGAGTLRPDTSAYIPYGTLEQQVINVTISNTTNYIYPGDLVWIENFNVTSTGNSTVQGNEIRIYPESDLQGEVDIKN